MNRGLTRAEAEAGVIPEPLSKAEWQAMADASLIAALDADINTINRAIALRRAKGLYTLGAMKRRDNNQQHVESRPSEDA
jgi:hypothetical protein